MPSEQLPWFSLATGQQVRDTQTTASQQQLLPGLRESWCKPASCQGGGRVRGSVFLPVVQNLPECSCRPASASLVPPPSVSVRVTPGTALATRRMTSRRQAGYRCRATWSSLYSGAGGEGRRRDLLHHWHGGAGSFGSEPGLLPHDGEAGQWQWCSVV